MLDWNALLQPSLHPLELVLRGSAVYWFLFALFRWVLRRDAGSVAIADVMLMVLIADASQNAMAGGYTSLTDGAVLIGTLAGWSYLLDWASYRWPRMRQLLEPGALQLVHEGRLLRANMRRELVTQEELHAALREQGLDRLEQVKSAQMESDGRITVVPRKESSP